uniref:19.5g1 protein putative n=1 Tax=Albugo laibachii Nc14 TaxID=890382 RepID=F0W3A3_9STRA|nr:19.5g1 protein putative [Albugo laibachii Nc14]|eukprot:CCA15546.1 19.5g1 protein putative [Albugo laibachii Nc14]
MEKKCKQNERSGPPPVLGNALEKDLRDWVIGMQRKGFPPTRDILINKGKRMHASLYKPRRDAWTIGRGWCDRIFKRFFELAIRNVQIIKKVRNGVEWDAVVSFFGRCARDHRGKRQSSRIFNLDETGFVQNLKTRKFIAVRGSMNVWSQTVETGFHLTMVVCMCADGFVVQPAFIVPGMRLNRDVLDASNICGATITTSEAGSMTTYITREYIAAFALAVLLPIKRPLALVFDGASSHMDASNDAAAVVFGVRLVQLPPNASYLYQPLDVVVFCAVKTIPKEQMYRFMIATGKTAMTKKEAFQLALTSWRKGIKEKPKNIAPSFNEAGIWPLSLLHDVKTSQKLQSK